MAFGKSVRPSAEIDDSLQEQQLMRPVVEVGLGVFAEEFGVAIHLLDPENHLAQAIKGQAERSAAATAECFAVQLAEPLEPLEVVAPFQA